MYLGQWVADVPRGQELVKPQDFSSQRRTTSPGMLGCGRAEKMQVSVYLRVVGECQHPRRRTQMSKSACNFHCTNPIPGGRRLCLPLGFIHTYNPTLSKASGSCSVHNVVPVTGSSAFGSAVPSGGVTSSYFSGLQTT